MIRHAKNQKATVCGLFINRTICRIYLFSSDSPNCTASIVRARYSTNSYLNQGTTKRSYIFIFAKISYRQRNPPSEKFQNKKRNTFIILVTLTLRSPSNPRLKPGIESNIIVCAVLFGSGQQQFNTSPPSSICPGFYQFGNILMCSAILLQYAVFKASIKHK